MKIVFFGDSVTEGCFELSFSDTQGGIDIIRDKRSVYHNLLKERIEKEHPELNVEFINAGISGNSSADGVARLEKDVISHGPDIVVVCFGLNDIAGRSLCEYVSNMEQIFRTLRDKGIQVILLTPNMFNTYVHGDVLPGFEELASRLARIQNENRPDTYYEEAKKKALELGCIIVDCYSAWKKLYEYGIDVTELLSNRLNHPTRAMHKLFADMLYDKIVDLL